MNRFLHFRSAHLAALAIITATLLRNRAEGFVYDAANYWHGANALVTLQNPYEPGFLALRGILTSVVYMPATWVSQIIGSKADAWAVLGQNALLLAFLGAYLVPQLLRSLGLSETKYLWLSATLVSISYMGFAAYPLMDLWAMAALFTGILFAFSRSARFFLVAGVLFSASLNLRPGYLLPVLAVVLIWLIANWRKSFGFISGLALALIPQVTLNWLARQSFLPWPVDSAAIASIQSMFASYVLRYDTVAFDATRNPAQFFCSPTMSSALRADVQTDTLSTLSAYVDHFPRSVPFIFEKVAGSFMWSFETPYLSAANMGIGILAIITSSIAGFGIVGLIWHQLRAGSNPNRPLSLALVISGLAVIATLIFSTSEARFAAPLLLLGILGTVILWSAKKSAHPKLAWLRILGVLVTVAILVLGSKALAHPAIPGGVTAEICATT